MRDDIPEAQILAVAPWYTAEISVRRLPATPAEGTGWYSQVLPFFGTSNITAAMIPAVGVSPTNVNFANNDRDPNGRVTGDGTSHITSNVSGLTTALSMLWVEKLPIIYDFSENFNPCIMAASDADSNIIGVSTNGASGGSYRNSRTGGAGALSWGAGGFPGIQAINGVTVNSSGEFDAYTGTSSTPIYSGTIANTLPSSTYGYYAIERENSLPRRYSNNPYSAFAIMNKKISGAEYASIATNLQTLMASPAFGRVA
ncbi:MAG: hypothetical protein AAFY26_02150 [Cyanobacteria bacterium J06638_22]